MSPANRGTRWSNSGMVVEIHPEDVEGDDALCMMRYQERLEELCWQQGNMKQTAPAQRMMDFVNKKVSFDLPESLCISGCPSLSATAFAKDSASSVSRAEVSSPMRHVLLPLRPERHRPSVSCATERRSCTSVFAAFILVARVQVMLAASSLQPSTASDVPICLPKACPIKCRLYISRLPKVYF